MAEFPTNMVEEPRLITAADANETVAEAAELLLKEGLVVVEGLTPFFAGSVAVMATQDHIRKFSPEDQKEERFATEGSIKRWLGQEGGRAMFLLLESIDGAEERRLAGYGWAGPDTSVFVDYGETGFAVRVGERYLRSGVSTPFAEIMLETAREKYDAKNFWTSLWATNKPARRAYEVLGFETVYEHEPYVGRKGPGRKEEPDNRMYMKLPEPREAQSTTS